MNTQSVQDYNAFARRYVELWNGGDDDERRRSIRELFADDASHVAPRIAVRGYEELEARVTRSQQRWIVEEGCRFVLRGDAGGHHNVVRFTWEMRGARGNVESVGTEILVLDADGKITAVYQFIEA